MKLCRLDLLRYGHLSDVGLSFPEDVRLHVVHGANEAGKSTALAAIADALFGFGHRTDFDFLHGAPNLRVGITLSARDGTVASFVRRKGRRDTLRDAHDETVPDDAMRRFLGGVGRDLFERGFGLDGARLREGGRELLRLGGEVGESLLAGAGLLNLRAALARLDEEAKSLVGDGRGRRRLSDAADAWRRAQRESDERAVAPRAWQDAETAHTTVVAELADVQRQIRVLAEEGSQLQRVRRVAPLLAQLGEARESLKQVADAPLLPADIENRFHVLVDAHRDARRDREREISEVQRLTVERAALPQDTAVIALQDVIDTLVAQRAVVQQAIADLPQVQTSAANLRAKIMEAVRALGLSLAPEAARDALPTAVVLRTVQRLIRRHAALDAEVGSAKRAIVAGRLVREQAAQVLAASPEPRSPELLRRTIEAARSEGPLDRELSRAERVLAEAEDVVAKALAALPLWRGDLETLRVCPLPLPAETDTVAKSLDTAKSRLIGARKGIDDLTAEIAELENEVVRLSRGEMVPTPDAVTAARAARDRIWRVIRRMQEGGMAATDGTEGPLPDGHLPDVFEVLRDEADRLADRRAGEAQRVADFLSATDRLDSFRQRLKSSEDGLRTAEAEADDAEAAWRALWVPAGLEPLTPPAMTEWRQARMEILRRGEEAAAARRQRDEILTRRETARAALAALLTNIPPQETLSAALLHAETVCSEEEAKVTEHAARKKALSDAEQRLPELQQSMDRTATALESWQQAWSAAVIELRLPSDADIDAAETALEAWARIAETVPAWHTDEDRIAAMKANIETFTIDARSVLARLGSGDTGGFAPVIASHLGRRLTEARKAASETEDLTRRIADHEQAAAESASALNAAEMELAALRQLAKAPDNAGLQREIERARQRDVVASTIARAEQSLATEGDGMPEAVLRAEAVQTDLDAVIGRLAEIQVQQANLGEQREILSAQRARSEAKLAELREGHDAAMMAQQAEDALAAARDAAERYARLHVARVLLRSGIDRFRKEQQGPLLRSAGEHFALLTNGRYERLIVDYDAADRPVLVAIRDTGTECPVEALSEGARDQLYLALRVAAVQAYAAQAEPLPFIADDLLVHFDDTRATAAIALLAELGKNTQVILFTHHDHIVALAGLQEGVVVQNMPTVTTVSAPVLVGV